MDFKKQDKKSEQSIEKRQWNSLVNIKLYIEIGIVTLAAIWKVRVAFETLRTIAPIPWTIVWIMTITVICACELLRMIFFSFSTSLIPYCPIEHHLGRLMSFCKIFQIFWRKVVSFFFCSKIIAARIEFIHICVVRIATWHRFCNPRLPSE